MSNEDELAYYRNKYKDEARVKSDEYFRYIRNGRGYKAKLPKVIRFIDKGSGFLVKPERFKAIAFRKPLKGEYYLSGAIPEAYLAPNNLTTEYIIVQQLI